MNTTVQAHRKGIAISFKTPQKAVNMYDFGDGLYFYDKSGRRVYYWASSWNHRLTELLGADAPEATRTVQRYRLGML